MKNKKIVLIVGLFVVLLALLIVDFVVKSNSSEESTGVANVTSDKTWSESSIFTNEEYQKKQKENIKSEYLAFDYDYTLEDPYIKVNPYDINPLTAYIMFENDTPVKYTYEILDDEGELNFTYEDDQYSKSIVIPVIGLFENRINKVKITTEDENGNTKGNTVDISTSTAEYNKVDISIKNEIDEDTLNGWYFDPFYNAFDTDGNIRYNLNAGVEDNYMKVFDNHLFVKVDNYQTIYEINAMGEILAKYETPSAEYNFHHDLVKTPSGKMYALGSYNVDLPDIPYSESFIFEYDKPGKPTRIIDTYDLFSDNLVSPFGTPNQNDMIHINSIEYLEKANELVLSSQSQSFIAAVNIDTEEVDWVIQDENGMKQNQDKLLQIIDEDKFERTSGQHSVFLTENSKYDSYRSDDDYILSIFNNNNCKDSDGNLLFKKYEDPTDPETCTYDVSDVLVYDVNVKDKTVEQIDSFTIGNEYAPIMSSVFDSGDDFIVHFNQGSKPKSFLINNEGETLIEFAVEDYGGNGYYRANFLKQEKLKDLVKESNEY